MRRAGAALLLAAAACVAPRFRQPAPQREWPGALATAQRAVEAGRFVEADAVLRSFAHRHEGSPEARESLFWRAVFMLEPANAEAAPGAAAAAFEVYLASAPTLPHRVEALTLRRVAARLDSLARASGAARGSAEPARTGSQEEELQRLRDELKRTTEELDRIKRRLAAPRP